MLHKYSGKPPSNALTTWTWVSMTWAKQDVNYIYSSPQGDWLWNGAGEKGYF